MKRLLMKHNHPLTLNGGSSPSQFILAHEHDRGDEPHEHDVTPDGKTATSTRYSEVFETLDPQAHMTVIRAEDPVVSDKFNFPRLRKLVDECVRTLNELIVAHTKDGLDMPVRLWASIEQADVLVNSVQDAIPVRTIVRYPAYIDVFVESDATGENCRITRTAATLQVNDASASTYPNTMPWVLLAESETAGEQALEFTNVHVPWPDPKLEG